MRSCRSFFLPLFLSSSFACDFYPKHGLKQILFKSNYNRLLFSYPLEDRDVQAEAEAVEAANFCRSESGKRVPLPLPLRPIIPNVKNLKAALFFVKHWTNTECLINHDLQKKHFKGLWLT